MLRQIDLDRVHNGILTVEDRNDNKDTKVPGCCI